MTRCSAPSLLRDPQADPAALVRGWLGRRYGETASGILAPAFLRSFEVADRSIQSLGFWVSEAPKSAFPDPVWIDFSTRTESLAVYDPAFKTLEERLTRPGNALLKEVIAEKDWAAARALDSVRRVEEARPHLRREDDELLRRQFTLALYVARAYRHYMEAYYRFRMWDHAGRGPVPPELDAARRAARALADEMEGIAGAPPVFCPASLRHVLDRLDRFIAGEPFHPHPADVVRDHQIHYPPVEWGICPPPK